MSSSAPAKTGNSSKAPALVGSGAPTPISPAPAGPDSIDLTGRQLGDYLLLRRLGHGGMAEVYLAEQLSLCRRVAFKVLRSNLAQDANYIRRFRVEAQTVASLVHPNIVQVYDVGVVEGVHYIAQEYVLGKNLKQVMHAEKSLPLRTAVSIMRQVASALERAARSGIVHRDIKPENILLTSGGEVKVADFGLARSEKSSSLELTQDNTALGTPLYMSPEQIEAREIDARSDIYSFGVTFYQMLAGRPPFEGDSPIQVAWKHVNTPPAPLSESALDASLPRELGEIVHKSLAKKPEERYQSAAEILRDLRSVPLPSGQEEWSPELEAALAVESAATVSKEEGATQELSRLLRIQRSSPSRKWLTTAATLVLAAIVTFTAGGVWAYLGRPNLQLGAIRQNILGPPVAPQHKEVEKKATVQEQYFHAMSLNTPEAFHSIEENFNPNESADNRYYALLAQQRLAEYYLERFNWPSAIECFKILAQANGGGAERYFQAIGFAGLAHGAEITFQPELERHCLGELQRLLPYLSDEEWDDVYELLNDYQQKWMRPLRVAPGATFKADFSQLGHS